MRLFVRVASVLMVMLAAVPALAQEKSGIPWRTDMATAIADATKEKKQIFLDIYAEWCPPCKMMDRSTFPDPDVQKLLSEFIPVHIDADKDMETVEKYSDGSLPTLAILESDGSLADSIQGYQDPAAFIEWVNTARNANKELARLEADLADNPADATKAMDLATRYLRVRKADRAVKVLEAIPADAVAKLSTADQAQLTYSRGLAQLSNEDFDAGVKTFTEFAEKFAQDPRSSEAQQYILQGSFLAAGKAFRDGNLERARELYTILAQNTTFPGVSEQANAELQRIDLLGKPAPELQVADWLSGEPQKLADLKGKVVALDFFQTVDPNSEVSRAAMEELRAKYGEKLAVVGVAVVVEASDEQSPEAIKAYLAAKKYAYPVALDTETIATLVSFVGMGTPWTVLVDQQGNVVYSDLFDIDRVPAKLEALLK